MSSPSRGRGFNRGGNNSGRFNNNNHGGGPPRGPSGYRNPGPSGAPYGPRHGLPANPTKREAKREREREREGSYADSEGVGSGHHSGGGGGGGKRTLTDFRIVGVECEALGWEWGVIDRPVEKPAVKAEDLNDGSESPSTTATDPDSVPAKIKDEPVSPVKPGAKNSGLGQPAPSRLRIYFHSASVVDEGEGVPRKRKKDVDEDEEDGSVRKRLAGVVEEPASEREEKKTEEKKEGEDEKGEEDASPEKVDVGLPEVDGEVDVEVDDDEDADAEGEADEFSIEPHPEQVRVTILSYLSRFLRIL